MLPGLFANAISGLEIVLTAAAVFLVLRARMFRVYWPMLPVMLWRLLPYSALALLRASHVLSASMAYHVYFLTFWISYTLGALTAIVLTYTIFEEAMRPLKGLKRLGTIIYRWAAFVSVALALSALLYKDPAIQDMTAFVAVQVQRSSSVIVLSLIAFVGFSLRPLGLSAKSRVFGLSLGLAFITLVSLVGSSSFFHQTDLFSAGSAEWTAAQCLALAVWVYYLSVPEPKRRFILLPTTSPFHAWNQISEILGHDPGYVAIAGVPPEAFAPAELDIFGKASANMARVDAGEMPPSRPASYYINLNGQKLEDSYKPLKDKLPDALS